MLCVSGSSSYGCGFDWNGCGQSFGSWGCWRCTTTWSGGAFIDCGDDLANINFVIGSNLESDNTSNFSICLGGNLVGFELVDRLIFFDVIAIFYVPNGQDAAADGFAHCGNSNFSSHNMSEKFLKVESVKIGCAEMEV